jgi:hypothetical protein
MSDTQAIKPAQDVADISRREFIKSASVAGALGASGVVKATSLIKKPIEMPVNMAGYDYDRVHFLSFSPLFQIGINQR